MKNKKGITLISLVVTIIILIILAAISINLILGDNGLITKAKRTQGTTEQENAKEKLELELGKLLIEKETGIAYNDEILNNYLTEKGFFIKDDIVILNGWKFRIDKSVPEIIENLGKNEEDEEIQNIITISTKESLETFRDQVNKGISYEGKIIKLMNDINLNEGKYVKNEDGSISFDSDAEQWTPIGTIENPFKGTFDGQGYTIKGIYINDETKNTQGFIGQNTGGIVKNLTLDEGTIIAGYRIGGATGRTNDGTIENVINKMNISSKVVNDKNESIVGGISGSAIGNLKNCINYGNIDGVGVEVGGICGYIEKYTEDISNCANLCDYVQTTGASSKNYSYIGGIVGYSKNVNIEKCYNTADITAAKSSAGGIVGQTTGTINQCYNTGNIQSLGVNDSGNNTIGGIVGYTGNTVCDCYNIGNVTGTAKMLGGIVGSNGKIEGITIKQELKNCYNVGLVGTNKIAYRGGVVGTGASTSNCYYLTGQATYGVGASTATTGSNTNAVSKTKAQLQTLASTLGDNWVSDGKIKNESGDWVDNVDNNGNIIYINNNYPILKWQIK